MYKARNVASQIEQRVQLDCALAPTKPGPRKQAQAQVDRRGVERVDRLFEFDRERRAGVQAARTANQHLSEIGVNAPIVRAIRIGQRASRDLSTKAGVVQLWSHRAQARFDVAQALPIGELSKTQTQKLIAARETALPTMPSVARDTRIELAPRQKLHQLRKHELSIEHKTSWASPARKSAPRQGSSLLVISDRVQTFFYASCDRLRIYSNQHGH